ncbi:MAG: hypothetical protein H0V83_14020 [Rubrobacter sp.]|nr:hypothetical protein [Rubrobacter sp.]
MKRVAYLGFKGLAWIIFAIVLLQFFFAGIVVFGEETWGDSAVLPHRIAGWLVILASLVLLILAAISFFTGGARGATVGMVALLFVLSFVQLVLAAAYYMNLPIIAELHPVNALLLLGLSFHLARTSQSGVEAAMPSRVQ